MGALSPMDAKALQAHEVMKSCHDFDSVMTEGSLATIQAHYSVSDEYALHTSLPGQHPYSPCLHGFSVLVDALERSYAFLSTSLSRSIWLLSANFVGCRRSPSIGQDQRAGTIVRVADEPTPKRSTVESMPRTEDIARLEK
ncbi:hypothetical protein B296_00031762 [Ensete ventricosum]|uniref:Uncharacterized protein n=1 Tax=Ensete ventricosum TaxID=4639 RepID=A0A426ZQF9_ENSVE|nr:hypothetical protein B296_00031762 [Ensete ventricosum]